MLSGVSPSSGGSGAPGEVKRNSHVSLVSGGKEDSAMQSSERYSLGPGLNIMMIMVVPGLIVWKLKGGNIFCSDEETSKAGMGVCGGILLGVSWSLFLVTLPFSLLVCFKV